MLRSGQFSQKKILLLDKDRKTKNDRTWCFWEKNEGFFEEIVFRKWNTVSFFSPGFSADMIIAPYTYKMIRGVDFYTYCFAEIEKHPNVEVAYGNVKGWEYEQHAIILKFEDQETRLYDNGTRVFSSLYKPEPAKRTTLRLLQHFKGWLIETSEPVFEPGRAVMMDFRVHQDHGTTFAYVLPFNEREALVEYTLFTRQTLEQGQYDEELKEYILSFMGVGSYTVKEEEFGIIPMTNEKFSFNGPDAWQIGTAGGQTKSSSGYTFQFIQKQSELIVKYLLENKPLHTLPPSPGRFRFYDNTLLHILYYDKYPGNRIFSQLFKKNKPQQVLKFLDNETSLREELKIISSLPTWPFLKAALKQI